MRFIPLPLSLTNCSPCAPSALLQVPDSNADDGTAAISEWGGDSGRPDTGWSRGDPSGGATAAALPAPGYIGASMDGGEGTGDTGSASWKPKARTTSTVTAATPRGVPLSALPVGSSGGATAEPRSPTRPMTPSASGAGSGANGPPLSARAKLAIAAVRADDKQRMRPKGLPEDAASDLPAHAVAAAAAAAPSDLFSLAHDTVGSLAFQALVQQKAAERAAGASAWADESRAGHQQQDDVAELAILGALAIS
jgi:hypothetical protein